MDNDNVILSISRFKQLITKADSATALFLKKDGSERTMHFTLKMENVPGEDRPKGREGKGASERYATLKSNNMITVYDLDSKGWRVLSYSTCKWLEIQNENDEVTRYTVANH